MVDFKWMQFQSAGSLDRAGRQHLDRAALKQQNNDRAVPTTLLRQVAGRIHRGKVLASASSVDQPQSWARGTQSLIAKNEKLGISRPGRQREYTG